MSEEAQPCVHPKTIDEFEKIYKQEYDEEVASCDRWIRWCNDRHDDYGINFHQGKRSALFFHNIQMCQLIRILRRQSPNV